MATIYDRIIEICRERDEIPAHMCDRIGLPRSVLTMMKGRDTITSKNLLILSAGLHVSCDYLLTGKEFQFPEDSEEQALINAWHQCSDDERENVAFILRKYGMPFPQETPSSASKAG